MPSCETSDFSTVQSPDRQSAIQQVGNVGNLRYGASQSSPKMTMIRKAFKMSVNPDQHAEYARRHNPIWPELEIVLREHGVRNYSIFLDPATSELFAYAEIESEERWNAIGTTEVCRRWWHDMREIMPANPDHSPVSIELKEMFHLEVGV